LPNVVGQTLPRGVRAPGGRTELHSWSRCRARRPPNTVLSQDPTPFERPSPGPRSASRAGQRDDHRRAQPHRGDARRGRPASDGGQPPGRQHPPSMLDSIGSGPRDLDQSGSGAQVPKTTSVALVVSTGPCQVVVATWSPAAGRSGLEPPRPGAGPVSTSTTSCDPSQNGNVTAQNPSAAPASERRHGHHHRLQQRVHDHHNLHTGPRWQRAGQRQLSRRRSGSAALETVLPSRASRGSWRAGSARRREDRLRVELDPSIAMAAWRSPMMTPSVLVAVTPSTAGTDSGRRRGSVAGGTKGSGSHGRSRAAVVDLRGLPCIGWAPRRSARRRLPCTGGRGRRRGSGSRRPRWRPPPWRCPGRRDGPGPAKSRWRQVPRP